MPVETDADRAVFLNPDDFGLDVAWPVGSTTLVSAVFDDTFVSLSAGDMDFAQAGSRYQVVMRSKDVPVNARNGDQIALSGGEIGSPKTFAVLEIQPDGTGMTIVRLEDV